MLLVVCGPFASFAMRAEPNSPRCDTDGFGKSVLEKSENEERPLLSCRGTERIFNHTWGLGSNLNSATHSLKPYS